MNPLNLICHRLPERTFQIKGHYFPVCARCTGFYISMTTYIILAMFVAFQYTVITTVLGILLLVPCFIDGTSQLLNFRESNNTLRIVTVYLEALDL